MRIEVVHRLIDKFVDEVCELVMDFNLCNKTIPRAIFGHFHLIH